MLSFNDIATLQAPQWEDRVDRDGRTLRIRKMTVAELRKQFVGGQKLAAKDPTKAAERQDELLARCIVKEDGVTPIATPEDYRKIPGGLAIEWTKLVLEVNSLLDTQKEDGESEGDEPVNPF